MNPAIIFTQLTVNLSQLMNVQCASLRPQSLVLAATVIIGLITFWILNFAGFHPCNFKRQISKKGIKFYDSSIFDVIIFFKTLNV